MAERRLRVLVLAPRPPVDLTHGVDLIGMHVFPRLRHTCHVSLLAPADGFEIAPLDDRLAELFDDTTIVPSAAHVPALLGWSLPLLARLPLRRLGRLDLEAARSLRAAVREMLESGSYDVVHIRNVAMAPFVPRGARVPRVLEAVDAPTLANARSRKRGVRGLARRIAAYLIERRAIGSVDISTAVSGADAAALNRHARAGTVAVVANGVDTDYFHPMPRPDGPESVVFLGVMAYGPNVDAVRWLCEKILPILRQRRPSLRAVVVGRDPTDEIRRIAADGQVDLTGSVDDVRPFLAAATVFVAPMVTGSGIKNKVLEAMSMGLPIVATSIAVEALEIESGRQCLVADEPLDFAEAIGSLLDRPAERERMGGEARTLAEDRYSWDATAARYREIYDSVVDKPADRSTGRR